MQQWLTCNCLNYTYLFASDFGFDPGALFGLKCCLYPFRPSRFPVCLLLREFNLLTQQQKSSRIGRVFRFNRFVINDAMRWSALIKQKDNICFTGCFTTQNGHRILNDYLGRFDTLSRRGFGARLTDLFRVFIFVQLFFFDFGDSMNDVERLSDCSHRVRSRVFPGFEHCTAKRCRSEQKANSKSFES